MKLLYGSDNREDDGDEVDTSATAVRRWQTDGVSDESMGMRMSTGRIDEEGNMVGNSDLSHRSCVLTSDSRQIVVNSSARRGGSCGAAGIAGRKFNKAIIILSVLLVNYCNGLSASEVAATAAAESASFGMPGEWNEYGSYLQVGAANSEENNLQQQQGRTSTEEPTWDYVAEAKEESKEGGAQVEEEGAIKLVERKDIEEMSKATSPNEEIDEDDDDDYKNANYDRISGAPTNRFPGQERLQINSTTRKTTTAAGPQLNPETAAGEENKEENDEEGDFEFAPAEVNLPLTSTTTESAASSEESTQTVRSRRRRNNPHNHHAESARRTRLMDREEAKKKAAAALPSAVDYSNYDEDTLPSVKKDRVDQLPPGSNNPSFQQSKQRNNKKAASERHQTARMLTRSSNSSSSNKHRESRHKHQKNHHHQRARHHNPPDDEAAEPPSIPPNSELEKRHRKYAKEKYQRKLDKARKMQLQRDQKLHHQTRQLAELERQQQARQKVYFGNFADQTKHFDTIADIDQHIDGLVNKERYPNLARLQTKLKEDRDKELPPYIRKYNRRNKQLFDIIEGTNSPDSIGQSGKHHQHQHHHNQNHHNHHHSSHYHHQKQQSHPHLTHKEKIERWIEENLFEEQRRNPNQIVRPPEEDPELLNASKINALPGELGPAAADGELETMAEDVTRGTPSANVLTNRLSQTRAGNFVYHRIAQSQPSNTIGQAYGVIVRKPGLPFVAITDRRQEHNGSGGGNGKAKRV